MANGETNPTDQSNASAAQNNAAAVDGLSAAVNAAGAFNSFADTVREIEKLLLIRKEHIGWGLLVNPEDKGYSSDRPDPYEQF